MKETLQTGSYFSRSRCETVEVPARSQMLNNARQLNTGEVNQPVSRCLRCGGKNNEMLMC